MGRVIDLTHPLKTGIARISGHPDVDYRFIHTHEVHGRTNAVLSFSIHMGTHIDPPYHFHQGGQTIDEIPIETLMAKGFRFDVRGRARPGEPITLEMLLESAAPPADLSGHIVLIDSGWAAQSYFSPDYYSRGPHLAQDTGDWLVRQRVRAVGLTNSPDVAAGSAPPTPGDGPIHRTLLGGGVLIIENLANVEQLGGAPFDVYAFPLKIERGCGGPARVVAIER